MLDDRRAEGGGDGVFHLDDQWVFERIHERVGEVLHFAGFAQTFDDELFAEWGLIDDRGADHFAVEHDGDSIDTASHVFSEGDHLVGALGIERDGDRISLLRGWHGAGDVGSAQSHAAVEKDRARVLVAVIVLTLERVGLVAGDDFRPVLHAFGKRLAAFAGFVVAAAHLAELELGDFFKGFADLGRGFGFDSWHLDKDAVGALAGDQRLGGAHAVEAFFNHQDRLVDLLGGDLHFLAAVRLARLHAEGEGGSANDVDAAFESFLDWGRCQHAESSHADEQHGADIAFAPLDVGGEVPEEEDHKDHAGHKNGERIFVKGSGGKHGEKAVDDGRKAWSARIC